MYLSYYKGKCSEQAEDRLKLLICKPKPLWLPEPKLLLVNREQWQICAISSFLGIPAANQGLTCLSPVPVMVFQCSCKAQHIQGQWVSMVVCQWRYCPWATDSFKQNTSKVILSRAALLMAAVSWQPNFFHYKVYHWFSAMLLVDAAILWLFWAYSLHTDKNISQGYNKIKRTSWRIEWRIWEHLECLPK